MGGKGGAHKEAFVNLCFIGLNLVKTFRKNLLKVNNTLLVDKRGLGNISKTFMLIKFRFLTIDDRRQCLIEHFPPKHPLSGMFGT